MGIDGCFANVQMSKCADVQMLTKITRVTNYGYLCVFSDSRWRERAARDLLFISLRTWRYMGIYGCFSKGFKLYSYVLHYTQKYKKTIANTGARISVPVYINYHQNRHKTNNALKAKC
jgi:hypothetical protein